MAGPITDPTAGRWAYLWLLMISLLGLALDGFWPWYNWWHGILFDPDSYMNLVVVQSYQDGNPFGFVPTLGVPGGSWLHWSRPYSFLLIGAGWIGRIWWSKDQALLHAGGLVSVAGFLVLPQLLFWACPRPRRWSMVLAIGVVCATDWSWIIYGRPDTVRHHLIMLVPIVWAYGRIVNPMQKWTEFGGVLAGASLGLGLWITPETFPLVALCALIVAAMPKTPALPVALGLVGTTLVGCWLDPVPKGFVAWPLDRFGPTYLVWSLLVAGALVVTEGLRRGSKGSNGAVWWGTCMALAVGMGAWVAFIPNAIKGPAGLVPPELRMLWWRNVHEVQPITTLFAAIVCLAVPIACWVVGYAAWMRGQDRRSLMGLTWLLALSAYLFLASLHVREAIQLVVPAGFAVGWALSAWEQALSRWLSVGAVCLVSGCVTVYATPTLSARPPAQDACSVQGLRPALRLLGPIATLGFPEQTPMELFESHGTGLGGVAGPYHHDSQALLDSYHAWMSVPDDNDAVARSVVRARNIQVLITCPSAVPVVLWYGTRGATLARRLDTGQVPSWLAPMGQAGGFYLFRVKPQA